MKELKLTFWIGVLVVLVVIGPLLTLWALNTLFPSLEIPYTLETWFAVAILHGVLHTKISKSN
jgi:hypothetical protein